VADNAPGAAPYQALYRQYRPQRFSEVRGQEHVTRALLNAVREDRVAHAYLFSGPRGTGKTSTARILAMALNCEAPVAGEPDGLCPSCLSIRSGASMDVFELDAASNRKLEEMRDLLSRVALGTPGRWKVYIIDEVHQLTSDAASALLKTLEDPPSHVVFVLATTDPQRVLDTIRSRTQHFEFHLFSSEALAGLLEHVNEVAGLGLAPETLQVAVRRGRGSARDALSALDQLATAGVVEDEAATVTELVDALADRDIGQALEAVARGISSGKSPRPLGNDLVEHLRNAFLALQAPGLVPLPDAAGRKLVAEQGRKMGLPFLVRAMETVGQALIDMRDSVDPRVTLEVALMRVASPGADTSPAALLERVEQLEKRLGEADRPPAGTAAQVMPAGPPGTSVPTSSQRAQSQARPASAPAPSLPTRSAPAPATVPQPPPARLAGGTQPEQPAQSGPGQARVALGAFLRDKPEGPAAPPATAAASAASRDAEVTGGAPQAGHPPAATKPGALPSRDELTLAWGDTVFAKLSKAARVYLGNGRFVEPDGRSAVLALPDRGLLARAANYQAEAQDALTAHFGRPVPLRLVLDTGAAVTPEPDDPPSEEPEAYDMEDFAEATAVPDVPVEQRILQAFPGSSLHG
jgi:DNA polymerase-3 subunit gamma/tau